LLLALNAFVGAAVGCNGVYVGGKSAVNGTPASSHLVPNVENEGAKNFNDSSVKPEVVTSSKLIVAVASF
jgi:hypothetical protein